MAIPLRDFVTAAVLTFTTTTSANTALDELKNTNATLLDVGFLKLDLATKEWSKEYSGLVGKTKVSFGVNKNGDMEFFISVFGRGSHTPSPSNIKGRCKQVAYSFLSTVFGNYGNPDEKDFYGSNIYFKTWGSYFAPTTANAKEIENIGQKISKKSLVTVSLTDRTDCTVMADESFDRKLLH